MNRIKYLLLSGLLAVFSASLFAEGTFVLNAERAMLSTQYAQDEFKKLDEDADFITDRERLELLQTEGQAILDDFQKNQETLSDEQIVDMQGKLEDKQTEIQFLTQKLQNNRHLHYYTYNKTFDKLLRLKYYIMMVPCQKR